MANTLWEWTSRVLGILNSPERNVFTFLALSSLLKTATLTMAAPAAKRQGKKELVGKLSQIYFYPVKSCHDVKLQKVRCEHEGMLLTSGLLDGLDGEVFDRQWVLTNEKKVYITAIQHPKLMLIQPSFHGNRLQLDVAGMPTLKLPLDVPSTTPTVQTKVHQTPMDSVDCGDEAAQWFNTYLGASGYRLNFIPSWLHTRRVKDGPLECQKQADGVHLLMYQKESPHLLVSESSIDDLNTRLVNPVTVRNFRPNLVVSGCQPYDEDSWSKVYIGEAVFTKLKLLQRCPHTTIDPDTAIKDSAGEPLATLKRYRMLADYPGPRPTLCSSLLLEKLGTIRVGDPVYAVRES